jgi:hypothetical protein
METDVELIEPVVEEIAEETNPFVPAPDGSIYARVGENHKLIVQNQVDAYNEGLPAVEFEQGYDGNLYEKGYAPQQSKEEQNEIIKQRRARLYEELVDPLHAQKNKDTIMGEWSEEKEQEYIAEVKRLTIKIREENPYIE